MKIFKGDMSLWKQLTNDSLLWGPGGLSDKNTYRPAFGGILIAILGYFFFWNIDAVTNNISVWLAHPERWLFDVHGEALSSKAKWHHVIAKAFFVIGIFTSFLAFYSVWSTRRRARKNTQGQWYGDNKLTKDDLYGQLSKHDDPNNIKD